MSKGSETSAQHPRLFRTKGCRLWVALAVFASVLDRSTSFTVPPPRGSSLPSAASCGACSHRDDKAIRVFSSTIESDEDLLASVEEGTVDIEALEELFGEELDFLDDLDEEEEDDDDEVAGDVKDSVDEYVEDDDEADEEEHAEDEEFDEILDEYEEEEEEEEEYAEDEAFDEILDEVEDEEADEDEFVEDEEFDEILDEYEEDEDYAEDEDFDEEVEDEDFDEDIEDEEVKEEFDDSLDDEYESFDDEEEDVEEDPEHETELMMSFYQECQDTPIGELDDEDAEIIREMLGNIPLDAVVSQEEVPNNAPKGSYVMENLLHRFVDEWRDTIVLLNNNEDEEEGSGMTLVERKDREQIFRPTAADFHKTVVSIWKDEQNNDSPEEKASRIWKLLSEQMELVSFFEDDDTLAAQSLHPTRRSIEILLEALSKSSERGLDRQASEVFEDWLPKIGLTPSPQIYEPYIQMTARARQRGSAKRAEFILRRAVSEYPPNKYESPIKTDTFNAVVTAYAKVEDKMEAGPRRAQDLIVFMDELGSEECAPNAKTFTSLIDAYCQTNEWESVTEAQAILNNLLNQYLRQENDGKHLEPSVATWTIVIGAWMRLSKRGRHGAAKRAGGLLKRMVSLYSDERISAKPDAITYRTVYSAYAFSKSKDDLEEAENLLDEMHENYLDGDDTFQLSVSSITLLIERWIKAGAVDRAEELLKRYEDLLEEAENNDSEDYNLIMTPDKWQDLYKNILIGHCRFENPERAIAYLNLMIENDEMEPDTICYERIIECYTRLGQEDAAKKSQQVIEILEKRRQAGALKPTERVYTTFIKVLTKSKVPSLYKKADLILQRMHSLAKDGNPGIQPSLFTYNAVLYACAQSGDIEGVPLQDAFATSVRVFSQMRKETNPGFVAFGNMIKCAGLLPSDSEKREKCIIATFKLCCESGNVNKLLVRDLSQVASKDLWKKLIGVTVASDEDVEVDIERASMLLRKMPYPWQQNAIENERKKPPKYNNSPRSFKPNKKNYR